MNLWQDKFSYSQQQIDSDMSKIKRYFPNCISVIKSDVATDKEGVDYIATLKGGAVIYIDAKTRLEGASRFWKYGEPELPLEIYSVVETKKIGWTLSDSAPVDYIMFTFAPKDTPLFYILPFQQLRKAFWRHFKAWHALYGMKEQASDNWHSSALFVPASVVVGAVSQLMVLKEDLA